MAAIAAGFRANKRDSNNNLLDKAQCAFDQTSLQCLAVKKTKQNKTTKNNKKQKQKTDSRSTP